MSPSLPSIIGGTASISTKAAEELSASTSTGGADEWKFEFHGYFRAPVRTSIGPKTPTVFASNYSVPMMPVAVADPRPPGSYYVPTPPYDNTPPSPGGLQLHGVPRVPGYLYTTWEYTNTVPGPWAQLNFSYGNSRVTGTVIIDSYAQTDGGYRHLQAQQGIDQVFLTMNFPELFGEKGGLIWNLGSFQNRYGAAGKYDGGMYETYLFGRTHIAGSTWTANLSNFDFAPDWAFTAEGGVGSKIEVVPFTNNAFYQIFANYPPPPWNSGSPYIGDRNPDYLPYAGIVPQGSTYLWHAHLGAKWQKYMTFGLHYLFTWTPDDNWHPINSRLVNGSHLSPRRDGPIQGSMGIMGGEVKVDFGAFGWGYLGYSHIDARNIAALADSIEVLHSYGGSQFKQNYFGRSYNGHTGFYTGPQNETGTLNTISAQYSFSFGQWAKYPEDFWGDGVDLVVTAFGMLTMVDSKPDIRAYDTDLIDGYTGMPLMLTDPASAPKASNQTGWDMSTKKFKWGLDAYYTPISWLGLGARFDLVQPDLDAAYSRPLTGLPGGSDLNFAVITPRLVFRTAFVTHETISIVYQRYFLGESVYPPFPYEWLPKADANVLAASATLWW